VKKKITAAAFLFLSAAAVTAAAIVFIPLLSNRQGTLKTNDGAFFRIQAASSFPGYVIFRGSPEKFDSRETALNDVAGASSISVISAGSVEIIDYSAAASAPVQSTSGKSDTWNIKFKDYIGEYRINAAGNNGFLFLYARGNSVYGTVRFPSWGKGVQEPLKNLKIGNGTISFTRSAKTPQELSRLGVSAPFSQEYSGTYLHSGNTIKGTYSVSGVKKSWEALKK
jgi:hypothetical protein